MTVMIVLNLYSLDFQHKIGLISNESSFSSLSCLNIISLTFSKGIIA